MTLRSLIFWPHLVAGVCAGLVIFVMSVTGALLMYERQIVAWADRGHRSAPPAADARRLSIDTLIERFRVEHPDLQPTAVTIAADRRAPGTIAVPSRTFLVDVYSGRVLGESSTRVRRVMSTLREWHRYLGVGGDSRRLARAITGWSNVVFLFIVCSGFYLWFPRTWTWRHVRSVTWFSSGLGGKARDFNWHNVIGVWSAVPLFVVVLTAMPIAFPWANALLFRAVGEAPPARNAGPPARREGAGGGARGSTRFAWENVEPLWVRAEQQVPGWQTITLRPPTSLQAPLSFAIDEGDGGQPQLRSTLTVDRRTGDIAQLETFADQSLGRRLRSLARFTHTGESLGAVGQTIAGVVSAGGAFMVWTGVALAWRRLAAWMRRRGECRIAQSIPSRPSAA